MNRYETFIIIETDATEEDRKAILERVESLISGNNGELLVFDEWGTRKLAYPIRKKNQAYYVRADYCGTGKTIDAIERILRQDTRIMRYMTVRLETNPDLEALRAEMTRGEEKPVDSKASDESEEALAADVETETAVEAETETAVEAESETAVEAESETDSAEKE